MDIVTPGIGLIFWSSITFIFLVLLLKKFAWRPILTAVHTREESIREALETAEEARKEIQNLKADNQRIMDEARKDRDQMLSEARKVRDNIVSEAREEAIKEGEKLIESAKVIIRQERQEAVKELRSQVASLSLDIAQKILNEKLSDKNSQLRKIETILNESSLN